VSVGKQLLFSVLSQDTPESRLEAYETLANAGVSAGMFPAEDERAAFRYISEHVTNYGSCPIISIVELETAIQFPRYVSESPFAFWLDQFREYLQNTGIVELLPRLEQHVSDGRTVDAVELLGEEHRRLRDLLAVRRTTLTAGELSGDILDKHSELQLGCTPRGIFTGFPYVDEITGGVQAGDFWVIAGESGTGKTYTLCKCVMSAVQSGKKAIFVSMEMPIKQLARRVLAMGASVDATGFRMGRLSVFAIDQVRAFIQEWNRTHNDRLILVEGGMNYTVQRVLSKIKEIKPDAVFIDGAYMLKTAEVGRRGYARWEMQVDVVEALKQAAMEENIGIVATFQFDQKQKAKSVSTIMGGQAVGQIASVVLGIENEGSQEAYNPVSYKELTLYKGREGEKGKIRLKYDMNRTIIEEDRVLEGFDVGNID
jgi:replicative DNA helicase